MQSWEFATEFMADRRCGLCEAIAVSESADHRTGKTIMVLHTRYLRESDPRSCALGHQVLDVRTVCAAAWLFPWTKLIR